MSQIDLLSVALDYHKRGWNVLPVEGKRPTVSFWDKWQTQKMAVADINRLESYWQSATGIAVLCGPVSGNLVVIDLDGQQAIDLFYSNFPNLTRTYTVKTGRGVHLYFYQHHHFITDKAVHKVAIGDGEIAVRVQNCYVVAPPSMHETGVRYEIAQGWKVKRTALLGRVVSWIEKQNLIKREAGIKPASIETVQKLVELPAVGNKPKLTEVERGQLWAQTALTEELAKVSSAGKGERNDRLYHAALKLGSIIAAGYLDQSVTAYELTNAAKRCGLPEREAYKTIHSGIQAGMQNPRHPDDKSLPSAKHDGDSPPSAAAPVPEEKTEESRPYKPDDDEIAESIARDWKQQVMYLHNEWYVYEGGQWKRRHDQQTQQAVRVKLREFRSQQIRVTTRLVGSITKMLSLDLFKSDDHFTGCQEQQNQYINLGNGLFNLETMELESHRPDLLFVSQLNFNYDPTATCPIWQRYIESSLVFVTDNGDYKPDMGLICLLQEAIAYSMTARTDLKASFWLVGVPDSGKSTMLAFISTLLGDMATTIDLNQMGANRFMLSNIVGKRVVTFPESDSSTMLPDALYKAIVGGQDVIYADVKNKPGIAFKPTAKLWWGMNNAPRVADRSGATFNRLKVIPFLRTVPLHERMFNLEKLLLKERPGIFNWLMEGYSRLLASGQFTRPMQSVEWLEDYQMKNDTEGTFIRERCDIDADSMTKASYLYQVYSAWCQSNGFKPKNSNQVADEWVRFGFEKVKRNDANYWKGVRISANEN